MWDQDGSGPRPPLLVVAGNFTVAGSTAANRIATFDFVSGALTPLGSGMNDIVTTVAVMPNGDLIAGGWFTVAGGVSANGVARWNGTSWSALGAGMSSGYVGWRAQVEALTVMPNGDLIAGGWFDVAGGVSVKNIARWDGANWSDLGSSAWAHNDIVRSLLTLSNGDLVAGGFFWNAQGANCVARWDGASWVGLGSGLGGMGGFYPGAWSLMELANGDLIVGGSFDIAGGTPVNNIARWDGLGWSTLGAGLAFNSTDLEWIQALATLPNGDIVAGGFFSVLNSNIGGAARWDGASWSSLGAGYISHMTTMPNGDLIAAGGFIANGSPVGVARLTTTCPAAAVGHALGCPGSGGSNTLIAANLPWLSTTFHALGTGLPGPALVVAATSFTPIPQGVLPLASLAFQAPIGCDLLVTPDILEWLYTTTGAAQSSVHLPNLPALVGMAFYHQMVPVEFDSLGNVVAVTATNALRLTVGHF